MSIHLPVSGRRARVSLLIATLLYIVGVTVGPAAHLSGVDRSAAVELTSQSDGSSPSDPGSPAPHNELDCFVCQALNAPGVPAIGSPPVPPMAAGPAPTPDPELTIPLRFAATPRARAPPPA